METNPVSVRVRVPYRVRHRLGQRELEIGDQLLGQRDDVGDPTEREARKGDVLRAGRNAEPNGPHSLELLTRRLDQCRFAHRPPHHVPGDSSLNLSISTTSGGLVRRPMFTPDSAFPPGLEI